MPVNRKSDELARSCDTTQHSPSWVNAAISSVAFLSFMLAAPGGLSVGMW